MIGGLAAGVFMNVVIVVWHVVVSGPMVVVIHIRRIKQERNKQKITFSFTYLTKTYFFILSKNYLFFFLLYTNTIILVN